MSLLHFEAHTDSSQLNANQSRSVAVGNVATNGAVSFTPFINYTEAEAYDTLLAGTVAVTSTTNCTVTNGTLEMGRSRLITPSSTGAFSATFTITHDKINASGQVVKSYTVSGTAVAPASYGLQVFNAAGDIRLDFSKKNLRLNSVITGKVTYNSGWPTTHDVNITGLGYPSAAEWSVIQVNAASIYNVAGILTSASSATSNGVLRLNRSSTGSFTWDANFTGSFLQQYNIFDDVDPSFQLAVFRV